jgi:hypothetical protein
MWRRITNSNRTIHKSDWTLRKPHVAGLVLQALQLAGERANFGGMD